jgi:hypothetical protein
MALPSKRSQSPIMGLQMENSIVYPVVNPNTGNSFQLQLMRMFTWASVILSPADHSFLKQPGTPVLFFYALVTK